MAKAKPAAAHAKPDTARTDCFGYTGSRCNGLLTMDCRENGGRCKFYRSRKDALAAKNAEKFIRAV